MSQHERPQPTNLTIATLDHERDLREENRFARTSSDYRLAIIRQQSITPADTTCPGAYVHVFGDANDDLVASQSATLVPAEFRANPAHPKYRALFERLGISTSANAFLQTVTNPEWGKYGEVTYSRNDTNPVVVTSSIVSELDHPSYRLICAIAHNASVAVHAEIIAEEPSKTGSEMAVLYDGRRRLLNPNDIDPETFEAMQHQYLTQAEAFLSTFNPSPPERRPSNRVF